MEGLPIIPMLAPQFRASTLSYDNITRFDFRTKVKEYILLHFQADPHAYDEAFRELSDMKFEANNPSATIESSCKMKRYFGQLCMIQKRFPMSAGQELETPFAWFDSLSDNRHPNNEITHGDIEFEKASVMFNIGAAHAQIAANADRETQDSIKNAFMHCQYAAYAFEQLKNERYEDIFYPSVDLDPQVVLFLEKLMLAQAQECLVQKSLLDNRSPIVIGKLSYWLYQTYEEMITICEDWNVNISERIQRVYIGICRIKSDLYATIAYLSMGDNAESETKKMGYRLQYYNISLKYMKNVLKIKGLTEYHPEFLPAISFLNDVITAKKSKSEYI
ncbi:unnamed protein product [Caenorhabditis angaria]|uniref:BRO1 domain-containing protein n=1 Tax=Caenorhabditis angaria TaxID=860376 RepID=A0A9P1I467_9PELO|nr:unnamed protein product [Caenorhabditis angaria]